MNPIDHWLSDEGRKAIKAMGWPEWKDDDGIVRRLRYIESDEFFVGEAGGKSPTAFYDFHVALALLRDRAREWLEEKVWFISPGLNYGTYAVKFGDWTLEGGPFDSYDAALISAIIAAGNRLEGTV